MQAVGPEINFVQVHPFLAFSVLFSTVHLLWMLDVLRILGKNLSFKAISEVLVSEVNRFSARSFIVIYGCLPDLVDHWL
jgi:hypothetical protein